MRILDPFVSCRRIYGSHFMLRMRERHLPENLVSTALRDGVKRQLEKGKYEIKWQSWCLIVTILGTCSLLCETAILDK